MPQSPKTSDGLSWQLGMSALIPTIGKTRGTPVPIAVTQTARDALSAKLAALRECSDGGGDHSCFSGVETYRELLTRMAEAFGQHRQQQQETNRVDTTTALSSYQQTPLVRRGYAIRVRTVLEQIHSYLQAHVDLCPEMSDVAPPRPGPQPRSSITVVCLGAGLDVTGLWCLEHIMGDAVEAVMEVDLPDVCHTKRELLSCGSHWIDRFAVLDESSDGAPMCSLRHIATGKPYHLLAADLNNPSTLTPLLAVHPNITSASSRVLVVTELVLSYVPNTDHLLSWMTHHIPNLTWIAYETMGFPCNTADTATSPRSWSVLAEYQYAYSQQFHGKLQRGSIGSNLSPMSSSTTTTTPVTTSTWWCPLGNTCHALNFRFGKYFQHVDVANAGVVARYWQSNPCLIASNLMNSNTGTLPTMEAPMDFDEHIGLVLHLQSYAVVCASGVRDPTLLDGDTNATPLCPLLYRRICCPWKVKFRSRRCTLTAERMVDKRKGGQEVVARNPIPAWWITVVEIMDERSIRELLTQTYESYAHKSIHKMLHSALKHELALSPNPLDRSGSINNNSRIRCHYLDRGGDFLLLVNVSSKPREVVGGIAYRRCTPVEVRSRQLPVSISCSDTSEDCDPPGVMTVNGKFTTSPTAWYEIHRLFVRDSYRRRGVASNLIHTLIGEVGEMSGLVATTPAILKEANAFYSRQKFVRHEQVVMRDLIMNTYIRPSVAKLVSTKP